MRLKFSEGISFNEFLEDNYAKVSFEEWISSCEDDSDDSDIEEDEDMKAMMERRKKNVCHHWLESQATGPLHYCKPCSEHPKFIWNEDLI